MKKLLKICVVAVLVLVVSGTAKAGWPEQDKLLASDGTDGDLFGESVSISGDYAIVGAHWDDVGGDKSGSAYIFKRSDAPNDPNWYQQCKLTASDGTAQDRFGCSVSISGNHAIVGANGDDPGGFTSGSAYIFKRNSSDPNWTQQAKLTASDGAVSDRFGWSVSISGDCAIVGSLNGDGNEPNSGAAYIFEMPAVGGWADANETAKLTASDGASGDEFGISVSINGDCAIVGAEKGDGNEPDSGAAYIFKMPDGGWVDANETAKLTASDGVAVDLFGISVSISGNYAIVGAYGDDNSGIASGSAYIFKMPDSGWVDANETAELTASDAAGYDYIGRSVSINGDFCIISADGDDDCGDNAGAAYVFKRSGTSWTEQVKLTDSDGAVEDRFGKSVSISGNYAIVGANADDDNGTDSGSAFTFKKICPTADLNGDCCVNFEDFAIMADEWTLCY